MLSVEGVEKEGDLSRLGTGQGRSGYLWRGKGWGGGGGDRGDCI